MNENAHALIAATAATLAGKAHTQEELSHVLFTLVRLCFVHTPRVVVPVRRAPVAGEVLPPQQRASWARATTVYDVPDHLKKEAR